MAADITHAVWWDISPARLVRAVCGALVFWDGGGARPDVSAVSGALARYEHEEV